MSQTVAPARPARPLSKSLLLWTRTLHIYATMLALILLIFFAFTGFIMNHPAAFKIDDFTSADSAVPTPMPKDIAMGKGDGQSDYAMKIEVYLRTREGARGERTGFDDMDDCARVQFTGPGTKLEYTITKADGKIDQHMERHNLVALMSDLHKGTGSGGWWRLLIDGAAIFLMFASLSGLVLWIALPKRRVLGIVALVVSVALCLGCYLLLIP